LTPPDKIYFKEKITKLILDKNLYYKMSQAARKKAEKFSSKTLAKKLENIYKTLLF
jgi:glycosyltransferase involved in cell wall biosynthesis